MMKKVFTGLALVLLLASMVNAGAKWETLSFTEDLQQGFEELTRYCLTKRVAVKDVLWANHTESADVKAGTTIYLPANQAELLSIWQHIGAWQPKALVPVNSGIAARRLVEPEQKAEPESVTLTAQQPEISLEQVIAQTAKHEPLQTKKQTAKKNVTVSAKQPEPIQIKQTAPAKKTVASAPKTAKKQKSAPEKVIAQTAKPDKILTAKRKSSQPEIPGLMDPIIVFSPNGDATNGPMRLIISGDKVEVVKLPQNALPKKPAVADINAPFASSYSYISYFQSTCTSSNLPLSLFIIIIRVSFSCAFSKIIYHFLPTLHIFRMIYLCKHH